MATLNQIRANQQNAQLSTGPRSVEGKAVVRRNALKSGIHAKAETALPFENPQDLEDLKNAYYELHNPANIVECGLVDDLIRDRWLLNRYAAIHGQLLTEDWVDRYRQEHPELSLGHAWGNNNQILSRLTRCISATRKSYAETAAALKKLKAEAVAQVTNLRNPGDQVDARVTGSSQDASAAIGFVPQPAEAPAAQSAGPSSETTSPKTDAQQPAQHLSHVPATSDEQPRAVGFVPPSPPDPQPDTATRL